MQIRQIIAKSTNSIGKLDAELLLAFVLRKNREFVITHPNKKLSALEQFKFSRLVHKKKKGYSVAMLTGHKEFFGLDFFVNKNVLIPRPETELMAEKVLEIITPKTTLIDIGTGSGCIPIAIAKNTKLKKVIVIDISKKALKIAKLNAQKNNVQIEFLKSNLLDKIKDIPKNTIITARNGITFKTTSTAIMRSSSSNVHKATATRLRSDLNLASITDEFAIEVPVEAVTSGTGGNIGRFSLISQNVSGVSNITNLSSFTGGTNAETDSEFRTRILSVFAGSNTGTVLGYETAIKNNSSVEDVVTVVPGDPLLTRDGTDVTTDSGGNLIVSDPGSGGKVDIYILGSNLDSNIDSFIYNDASGQNDPTDSSNDIILGQRDQDTTLSSSQRRVELLASNIIPYQPVSSILSVVGSLSGSNFIEKFTDFDGSIKGNYELLKDTGNFGGSVFGFDKLHFVSNEIELLDEEVTKGIFNGIDSLLFTDVTKIETITQNIFVTNENSTTSTTNRSSVQLLHTPVDTVNRVVNLTTGERYIVSSQNPDGADGEVNTTGRITISGSTLPVITDVLQVDYTWIKPYDNIFDFDNIEITNPFRTTQDSVDWSFGNLVVNEPSTISADPNGELIVVLTHPISKIFSINTYATETVVVSSGAVVLSVAVDNVIDMRRVSDGVEIFNTDESNGILSGTTLVTLPTDTLASDGDSVVVRFNATDIFAPDGYEQGTFEDDTIILSEGISDGYGTNLLTTYSADVRTLLPATNISALPASKSRNKFNLNGTLIGEQPTSNIIDSNENITNNLRRAASHIRITASSIGASGTINVTGTSFKKVSNALLTITSGNGYDINLSTLIKSDLGVSSLSDNVKVVKLQTVERVDISNSGVVTAVDNTYDIINYRINDNTFDIEDSIQDTSLNSTTVSLPRTTDNTEAILGTSDVIRVTFYYVVENDYEHLFFSRNGTQITDKLFTSVDRISVASGFVNAAGQTNGSILVQNYNQPISNTTYDVDYNYEAPKENERLTITFNSNSVLGETTLAIEDVRPITADVLIKEATAKDIDLTVRIVLLSEFSDSEQTVIQDAVDSATSFLNASSLGTTIDASDVVNNLYSVSGIDRVTIINFSTGTSGNVSSITASKKEYLRAGTISITSEER